jgi:hypothetical protein
MGREPPKVLKASWRTRTEVRCFPALYWFRNAKLGKPARPQSLVPVAFTAAERGRNRLDPVAWMAGGVVHSGERADARSGTRPTFWVWSSRRRRSGGRPRRRHRIRCGSWAVWRRVRPGCFLPTDPGPIAVAPTCNLFSRGQEPGRQIFSFSHYGAAALRS